MLARIVLPALVFTLFCVPNLDAQVGTSQLHLSPHPLREGQTDVAVALSMTDDDLWMKLGWGVMPALDLDLRAGISSMFDYGPHFGAHARYSLVRESRFLFLDIAAVAGFQTTLSEGSQLFAVPFGFSIGANVGSEERAVVLYALPHLRREWIELSPEEDQRLAAVYLGGKRSMLLGAIEFGGQLQIAPPVFLDAALSFSGELYDSCCRLVGDGEGPFFSLRVRAQP